MPLYLCFYSLPFALLCRPLPLKTKHSIPTMLMLVLVTLDLAARLCSTAIPSLKDNRGSQVQAITITIMVLAIVAVSLRLVARYITAAGRPFSATTYGMDDLLIVIALVSTLGHTVYLCVKATAENPKLFTCGMDILFLESEF